MRNNGLPLEQTRLVAPRALKGYAEGLGWIKINGVNGRISAYRSPLSKNHQLIIPIDERIDDYAERAADAVTRLADFEHRSPRDVLDHLLLPPADILSFRIFSANTEAGDVSLEMGARTIEGAKGGLLAVAHSVMIPQAYHPRLSREEARRFLNRCRLSTGRGSFVVNVACLLDQPPNLAGVECEPFARKVTSLFLDTLGKLSEAVRSPDSALLLDPASTPGMSANLCESLLNLRPEGDRSHVSVSAAWSRTYLPANKVASQGVVLDQEVFEFAEVLASTLRSQRAPSVGIFMGFVDELRGDPTPIDSRPAGEVRLTTLIKDEEIHARVDLNPDEYAIAAEAHLTARLVVFQGTLHRLPRLNKIEGVKNFQLIEHVPTSSI